MYYGVKNCYCIWSFALRGCPLEEASEDSSLRLNTIDLFLGVSILSHVHLCDYQNFLVKYITKNKQTKHELKH